MNHGIDVVSLELVDNVAPLINASPKNNQDLIGYDLSTSNHNFIQFLIIWAIQPLRPNYNKNFLTFLTKAQG